MNETFDPSRLVASRPCLADPAGRVRQAFDGGLPSLINPLECESDFSYEPIEIAWVGADLIYPDEDCEALRQDVVFSGRIEEVQRAINGYNLAIVQRARETGAFPVYPLYASPVEATEQDREQARQLLKRISSEIELDALELSLFSDHQGVPQRMPDGWRTGHSRSHPRPVGTWMEAGTVARSPLQAMHWHRGAGDQFLAGEIDEFNETGELRRRD